MIHQFKYLLLITSALLLLSSCHEDEFGDWAVLNDQWMENHRNDEGFTVTESGLAYKVIHQGYLRYPNNSSVIRVSYTGKLIDGTVFDSGLYFNYLSSAIKGWQEGIRLMRGGAHFIFYIPAELGYGEDGTGSIPPNSTLIFDVKLIESFN